LLPTGWNVAFTYMYSDPPHLDFLLVTERLSQGEWIDTHLFRLETVTPYLNIEILYSINSQQEEDD
jgi:hypothetical protein